MLQNKNKFYKKKPLVAFILHSATWDIGGGQSEAEKAVQIMRDEKLLS